MIFPLTTSIYKTYRKLYPKLNIKNYIVEYREKREKRHAWLNFYTREKLISNINEIIFRWRKIINNTWDVLYIRKVYPMYIIVRVYNSCINFLRETQYILERIIALSLHAIIMTLKLSRYKFLSQDTLSSFQNYEWLPDARRNQLPRYFRRTFLSLISHARGANLWCTLAIYDRRSARGRGLLRVHVKRGSSHCPPSPLF